MQRYDTMEILDLKINNLHESLQGKELYVSFDFPSGVVKTATSENAEWTDKIRVPDDDGDCQLKVDIYEKESFFSMSNDPVASRKLNLQEVPFDEYYDLKLRLLTVAKKKSAGFVAISERKSFYIPYR